MEDYGTKLLEQLVAARSIKHARAEEVLGESLRGEATVEEVLVNRGILSRDDVLQAKARLFGVPLVDLQKASPEPSAAALLPLPMAQRYRAVCMGREGDQILVVLADPTDAFAVHYIQLRTGFQVMARVGYVGDIAAVQSRVYAATPSRGPAPEAFRERVGQNLMRGRVMPGSGVIEETERISGGPARISLGGGRPRVESGNGESLRAWRELARLSLDLASTLDEDAIIDRILDAASTIFEVEAASLLLIDWKTSRLFFREARGPVKNQILDLTLPLDPSKSVAGWVAHHRAPASIPDVSADARHCGDVDEALSFRTRSLLAVPIVWGGDALGVLELINKRDGVFDQDDTEHACILAAHTAVALQQALTVQQLHNFFQQAMETLIETYQAFDPVSREHVLSVARLATAMGGEMGLPEDDMETLCYAALLHDIGKVRCADPNDPAHAERGADTLRQVALFSRVVPIVRHHHERYDGSGKPDGLSGEQIPTAAGLLAVAEAWFEEGGAGDPAAFMARFGTDFDPALGPVLERALPQITALA